MNNRYILVVIGLVLTLCAWAESPQECLKKHGDRFCIFVNPTPDETEIEGFNIERIALNKSATYLYVKTTQSKEDIVFSIQEMTRGGRLLMVLSLEDGSSLAITEDFDVMYQDDKGRGALFRYDEDRTLEYRRISKGD